jgi:hypothetical protein
MRIGERTFESVLRAGRREAFLFGVPRLDRRDGRLLSLEEIVRIAKPEGESWLGVQSVAVATIVGSEGRSKDFSRSFLPLETFLETRWTKVRDLFLAGRIPEAIRVCEYGGSYFVRDGNQRVSVAKTHGVEFMDADVTRYRTPVRLPAGMSRGKIPMFAAKLQTQRETRIFDRVPEELLGDAQPRSWAVLRALLARISESSDDAERMKTSLRLLYENTRALIRKEAVDLLFPGQSELDIFAAAMALGMRLGDEVTPAEAFSRLIRRTERRRGILSLGHVLSRTRRWLLSSDAEERDFFLQMSRLYTFRPGAVLHEGNKRWYRFLGRQLLRWHPEELRKRLGHRPLYDEFVASWYDTLYRPAVELHRIRAIAVPFPEFYRDWMHWRRSRQGEKLEQAETGLVASLDAYLDSRAGRRRTIGGA